MNPGCLSCSPISQSVIVEVCRWSSLCVCEGCVRGVCRPMPTLNGRWAMKGKEGAARSGAPQRPDTHALHRTCLSFMRTQSSRATSEGGLWPRPGPRDSRM